MGGCSVYLLAGGIIMCRCWCVYAPGDRRVLVTHVQPLTVKPRVYVSDRKRIPVEHTAEITCLDISADQSMVVTGQTECGILW